MPKHLAPLPGGSWAIWRWIELRSAGFPIQLVFKLSSPECAAAADWIIQAKERVQKTGHEALRAVTADLSTLKRNMEWDNQEKRKPLLKAKHFIQKDKLPPSLDFAHAGSKAIETFRDAHVQLDAAQIDFRRTFDEARLCVSEAIREIVQVDRFREAIIWQNRRAFHTAIESFIRKSPENLRRKDRRNEELVASYLQRYCAKNDTIGFFGPVGWARFVAQEKAITIQPGPGLLAERAVYFEGWCIDALAEALAQDEALLPWLAPRCLPHIGVDGTSLHLPFAPPVKLSVAQATVLRACDGERTAKELATDLVKEPANGLGSEAEVLAILKEMHARRQIAWTLEVPAEAIYPERHLRQKLERIGEPANRQKALGVLEELEAARRAVADAAGDAARLDCALDNLDVTFTRLTGAVPTRSAGETYAGRTLVYEDCRRDIEVTVGSELLNSLGPPLTLLLTSARWFMFQTSVIFREACQKLYSELVEQQGKQTVDLASFWLLGQSLIFAQDSDLVNNLVNDLQKRWGEILCVPAGRRRLEYSSQDLRLRVEEMFAAPRPGWPSARHISPDVMIAARGLQAIQTGKYQCVLGELHLGDNTLASAVSVARHPSPDELLQATEADLPSPRVVFLISKQGPTARLRNALISPTVLRLVYARDSCGVAAARALPIGMLVMEEIDGTLRVRARDGRLSFEIAELFGESLTMHVIQRFSIVPPISHTPRISFDRLVVCRETWRFFAEQIPFAWHKQEEERFLDAQRWRHTHAMPRFVFVRASPGTKPFYVDFASPILVNILAKAVRQATESNVTGALIKVTEMLPTPDQTWLVDSEGQRYVSELRMVAVDRL